MLFRSPTGIKNAIRAGVASIEHATLIDDEGIALANQRGTYLDMDIYDEECIQAKGLQNAIPKDFLEHDARLGAIQRENFRKAVRAGVKIVLRNRRWSLSTRHGRQAIRIHGEIRNDAHAGDPVSYIWSCGFTWSCQ